MKILAPNESYRFCNHHIIKVNHLYHVSDMTLSPTEKSGFIFGKQVVLSLPNGSVFRNNGAFCAVLGQIAKVEFIGSGVWIDQPFFDLPTAFMDVPSGPGRLSYIDRCSNLVVHSPLRLGDPCINALYFPEGVSQTFHVHPSGRLGVVTEGMGYAEFVHQGHQTRLELNEGNAFYLDPHTLHRFCTKNRSMSILVYHPDSDVGPTDSCNPMKSRTYISDERPS